MVLAGLGTVGVAAWAVLLDARTHQAEQTASELDRRIRYGNSLALAREVIYRKYLHTTIGPDSLEEHVLTGDWARVTIADWDEPVFGYDDGTRINKTGAVPFRAFSLDVEVGIDDGDYLHTFTYQLKSYSPVLGGNLVTVHKNVNATGESLEVTGNIKVEGRAQFWNSGYKSTNMAVRTDAALTAGITHPKLAFLDTSDDAILPSNFPFVAQTSGTVGGSADFAGKLNVVNNTDTPSNSYVAKIQSYGASGYASLDATSIAGSGSGADTNPVTVDDPAIFTLITSGSYTPANLAPYAPLSSTVLKVILADTGLSAGDLVSIMTTNQPLPDDVIGDVVSSLVLSDANEATLLSGADYHAFVDSGRAVINLNSPTLTHLIITNATNVEFIGQPDVASADALEAEEPKVIAIVNPTAEVTSMAFQDMNKRRVIIAVHNPIVAPSGGAIGSAAVTFTGAVAFPDWHVLFDFEGVRTKWDTSAVGGVRLYGGIRTDQLVKAESGSLYIRKETNVDVLETMASRTAWIETVRQDL